MRFGVYMCGERPGISNRNLFSDQYLAETLPATPAWRNVSEDKLEVVANELNEHWPSTASGRTVSEFEEPFVRRVFQTLGLSVGQTTNEGHVTHDSAMAASELIKKPESPAGDMSDAVVITWDPSLDIRSQGNDIGHPSYQMHQLLQENDSTWGILTNGRRWRLYHSASSHRLDWYYEIDLPVLLEAGDLAALKYFYCFFGVDAFIPDGSDECFLDAVYAESTAFTEVLRDDFEEQSLRALTVLVDGFLSHPDNHLGEASLPVIYTSSLVYLYRLLFVHYAEANWEVDRQRAVVPSHLAARKQHVANGAEGDHDHDARLWSQFEDIFREFDEGAGFQAYPGELFHTASSGDTLEEIGFLSQHTIGDRHLAQVIEMIKQRDQSAKEGIDYAALDVRDLGRLYENLLEYQPAIAEAPFVIDGNTYRVASEDETSDISPGEVYLTTNANTRKATGSYYTPPYVIEHIVAETLEPLLAEIRRETADSDGDATKCTDRVLELSVVDPAMGCGHFLLEVIDYLALAIVGAHADHDGPACDIQSVRHRVAQECVYGVDVDPIAVEIARMSLWLQCSPHGAAVTGLTDHLKPGNALVGSDITDLETIVTEQSASQDEETISLLEDYARSSLDGNAASDTPPTSRLELLLNVHTAAAFGIEGISDSVYDRLIPAVTDDDQWGELTSTEWFQTAQSMADVDRFFHWKLAFPEVFAGPIQTSGFDVVLGNPPWTIVSDDRLKRYLWNTYEYQSDRPDLYRFFIERGLQISARHVGMITPNTWFVMSAATALRRAIIERGSLARASRVPADTFEGVGANMITFLIDLDGGHDQIEVYELESTSDVNRVRTIRYDDLDPEEHLIELQIGTQQRHLARSMAERADPLRAVAEATTGYQLYHTSIHDHETIENNVYHSDEQKTDRHIPEVRGGSLTPFHIDPTPDGYIDASATFYRRPPERFLRGEKVLIREVTGRDGIVAAHTNRSLFFPKSILSVTPSEEQYSAAYLCGLLNSTPITFYLLVSGEKSAQALFPRLSISALNQLPVPSGTQPIPPVIRAEIEHATDLPTELIASCPTIRDGIETVAERLQDVTAERRSINLDLGNYLDQVPKCRTLADLPGFQLVEGASNTIFSETAVSRPSLKLVRVHFITTDSGICVEGIARYRPKAPDTRDTDRWGFVETDPTPIISISTDDTFEHAFLTDYLEYIVNRAADGTAGFRPSTTTTNSLIDRLGGIELPAFVQAATPYQRYAHNKQRAATLDAEFQALRELLDALVYALFELDSADRALIERTVRTTGYQPAVD